MRKTCVRDARLGSFCAHTYAIEALLPGSDRHASCSRRLAGDT
jgi:hypothetical protein